MNSTAGIKKFSFPSLGLGALSVWLRNFLYFRKTIWISIFWVFIEPLLYLLALGYGLGFYIHDIDGVPYIKFLAPAMMATTGMMVAFYESTYGCYTKLSQQNTYSTILLAPVSAGELIMGEILWGASKAFFSVLGVTAVSLSLGLIEIKFLGLVLVNLSLLCWFCSAFGVLMTSYAKNYDWFIYAQSGLIVPMSLLSGTYFPIEQMPRGLQIFAYCLPLTHSVVPSRNLLQGHMVSIFFLSCCFLFIGSIILTNWTLSRLQRRLTV